MLENAAREHRAEAAVLERKHDRIGAEVSFDLGEALQRLDSRRWNAFAVVERDRVDFGSCSKSGDLVSSRSPSRGDDRAATAGEICREGPVLEHLRAGARLASRSGTGGS